MHHRFEKAHRDLLRWRATQPALLAGAAPTSEVYSVVRAVDAAFKSEVLEYRVRTAVNSQSLNEAEVSHVDQRETLTGVHHGDFDWWLTEATLRALHAGIDAIAQLLNVVFELGVGRDDRQLPKVVVDRLKRRKDLAVVSSAVDSLWRAPETRDLNAFVNHVKHSGFPERSGPGVPDCLSRSTSIDEFEYDSRTYGPWAPADVEVMIDGFRRHAIDVLEVSACARQSP